MKTTAIFVYFLFNLFFLTYSYSQTYVPEDAFEQYLINQGYDTVLDNYVETANIENVTSLDLNFQFNIRDLTGIQDFTALTNLELVFTSITSLNLSGNPALTYLNVAQTNLYALDVTMNTQLTFLNVENVLIYDLDVSNNTGLTELYLGLTEINSIDVSNNIALTSLELYDTNISSLDVSNNTLLTSLYVDNTFISSLDLSANNVLTRLYATGTWRLNCIDVADATAATAGTGIYGNWHKDANCRYSEDCSNLSVLDFDVSTVYIGPNPIKNELQIELNNVAILKEVILFNVSGKQILSAINSSISTSYLQAGIYFVKIITDKGHFTKKLIKM